MIYRLREFDSVILGFIVTVVIIVVIVDVVMVINVLLCDISEVQCTVVHCIQTQWYSINARLHT